MNLDTDFFVHRDRMKPYASHDLFQPENPAIMHIFSPLLLMNFKPARCKCCSYAVDAPVPSSRLFTTRSYVSYPYTSSLPGAAV